MDSYSAFVRGLANRGNELMVFDWHKAARLILEMKPDRVEAGLKNDWEWTGGCIFDDGKPVTRDSTYLASTWATPLIDIDGEEIECYKMQSETDGWGSDTKWPESALLILKGK